MNNSHSRIEPVVIVHGGAGDIPDSRDAGKHKGAKFAAQIGYQQLLNGGSVLDAVESAVKIMESDQNFNAGYGSILNYEGNVEMEASIMDGSSLDAGCVTIVKDILHPISLARRVMERTNHTFLGGEGVMRFAKEQGFEILHPTGQLVTEYAKQALNAFKKDKLLGKSTINAKTEIGHEINDINEIVKNYGEVGTVGAVAIDEHGNIASATSTGGITGKIPGRIGDTPLLGCGTYADNFAGGVSTTGHGETIMRFNVAQTIIKRMEFLNEDAKTATQRTLEDMTKRLIQTAGAITIDTNGNIGYFWTSEKMSWAYQRGNELHWGIRYGDDFSEIV